MISDFIIAPARYLLRTIPLPCKGITIRALYLRDMDISYTPISRLQAPGTVLLQYSLTTEDSAYLTCLIFPSRLTQARRSRSHGPSQMIKSIPNQPSSEARETLETWLPSCKTMHLETAPTFYRTGTFYPSVLFDFSHTVLHRLTPEHLLMDRFAAMRHRRTEIRMHSPLSTKTSTKCTCAKGECLYG